MTVRIWYLTHLSALLLLCACSGVDAMPVGFAGAMANTGVSGSGPLPGAAGMIATPAGASGGVAGAVGGATGAAGSKAVGTTGGAGASAGAAGTTAVAGSIATEGGAAGAATSGAGGAAAGSAAVAGASGAAGAPAMHMDLGKGDGSDVITIGDSWMSYAVNGGGIEAGLRTASMQRYRNYAVAGTMLLDEVIPRQYASAKRANPDIKTVVMTGGGNDLLLTGMSGGPCTSGCMMTIARIAKRLGELWAEMEKDGVKDVVYIEYSRGGSNKGGVDEGVAKVKPVCDAMQGALRCHFVDSDPVIMMQLLDGVHPTPDGCQKLGKAAFDLMVKEGMRR
ncbi:MAG TPA: SGNH/GDSL hydrolase family protein [Polyangiales bacterium]|nr:SGNH/GDSL hydrolase family protein [Polyangiales bacterium]